MRPFALLAMLAVAALADNHATAPPAPEGDTEKTEAEILLEVVDLLAMYLINDEDTKKGQEIIKQLREVTKAVCQMDGDVPDVTNGQGGQGGTTETPATSAMSLDAVNAAGDSLNIDIPALCERALKILDQEADQAERGEIFATWSDEV